MGEAVYLHKPMLAVPLARQFEQVLNARYLEHEGYGRCADDARRPEDGPRLRRRRARLRGEACKLHAGRQRRDPARHRRVARQGGGGGDLTVREVKEEVGIDVGDAKWFDAGALPMIPPPMSISRKLIDAWLADVGAREAPKTDP